MIRQFIKFVTAIYMSLSWIFAPVFGGWPQTHEGGWAYGVAVDFCGDVIVTGSAAFDTLINVCTIKYDTDGKIIWTRASETNTIYSGQAGVVCDQHNNIIVGGCKYISPGYAYCTFKYNSDGTLLWSRTFADSLSQMESDITIDKHDNIIVTGTCIANYCTIKYDSTGTELWRKFFYNSGSSTSSPHLTTDAYNNVIISIRTCNLNKESYIVKYSSDGDSLWAIQFGSDSTDKPGPLVMDKNNNIVVGSVLFESDTSYKVYISKFNSVGTEIIREEYNSDQVGAPYSIAIDNDGNIVTAGIALRDSNYDYCVTKYTPDADSILWNKTYDKAQIEAAEAVAVNSQNEIFVTGATFLNDTTVAWLTLKYDANGNLIGVVEEKLILENPGNITVFPNPFLYSAVIKYCLPTKAQVSLKIYDITGRLVKTLVDGEKQVGNHNVNFDARNLATGIYFAKLVAGDYKSTKKLILVR